jgi:hypothetical protein
VEGDDHGEAYTVIIRGVGLSHEITTIAGAEAVATAEGNMCGAATQGTVALPGSEATSRMNGLRRNLGDLTPPAVAKAIPGRDRKSRRRSCRGRREESDGRIVPRKPRTRPTTHRSRRAWREGGRSKERQACDARSGHSAGYFVLPKQRAYGLGDPQSRLTFDKSPLRESRTVGSVRVAP